MADKPMAETTEPRAVVIWECPGQPIVLDAVRAGWRGGGAAVAEAGVDASPGAAHERRPGDQGGPVGRGMSVATGAKFGGDGMSVAGGKADVPAAWPRLPSLARNGPPTVARNSCWVRAQATHGADTIPSSRPRARGPALRL